MRLGCSSSNGSGAKTEGNPSGNLHDVCPIRVGRPEALIIADPDAGPVFGGTSEPGVSWLVAGRSCYRLRTV